jgi:hypothetical protein
MTERMTLSGDYGLQQTRLNLDGSTIIDASDGRWIVSNIGSQTNRYPVFIENGDDVTLIGGTIDGRVPMDMEWRQAYVNSTAIFSRNADEIEIRDWSINRAWDGIRVHGDRNDTFEIDNVYMTKIRDDAIENDMGLSGTIKNSLFDGVFVGLSTSDENTGNMSGNLVELDNVMIRIEPYLYKGALTHGSPFKVWTNSPKMNINDSVIAIQNPNHFDYERLKIAWDLVEESSNNYYLNLSDKPFPKNYPLPGKGFTVLQGKAARDYWAKASAEWENGDNNDDADDTPSAEVQEASKPQKLLPESNTGGNDVDTRESGSNEDVPEKGTLGSKSSEAADERDDDDGPSGFFGIIAKIFRAIFGRGRDSDDDVAEADATESGSPLTGGLFTDEDLSRLMLPPVADDSSSAGDFDDSEEDGLAVI